MNPTNPFVNSYSIRKRLVDVYYIIKSNPVRTAFILITSMISAFSISLALDAAFFFLPERIFNINEIKYSSQNGNVLNVNAGFNLKSPYKFDIKSLKVQFLDKDKPICDFKLLSDIHIDSNVPITIVGDFEAGYINGTNIYNILNASSSGNFTIKVETTLSIKFLICSFFLNKTFEKNIPITKKENSTKNYTIDLDLPKKNRENTNVQINLNLNIENLLLPSWLNVDLSEFCLHLNEPKCLLKIEPIKIEKGVVCMKGGNKICIDIQVSNGDIDEITNYYSSGIQKNNFFIRVEKLNDRNPNTNYILKKFFNGLNANFKPSNKRNTEQTVSPNFDFVTSIRVNKNKALLFDININFFVIIDFLKSIKVAEKNGFFRGSIFIDEVKIGSVVLNLLENNGQILKNEFKANVVITELKRFLVFLMFKKSCMILRFDKCSFINGKKIYFTMLMDANGRLAFNTTQTEFMENSKLEIPLYATNEVNAKHNVTYSNDQIISIGSVYSFRPKLLQGSEIAFDSLKIQDIELNFESSKASLNLKIYSTTLDILKDNTLSMTDRIYGSLKMDMKLKIQEKFYTQNTTKIAEEFRYIKKTNYNENDLVFRQMVSRYNILVLLFTDNGLIKGNSVWYIDLNEFIQKYEKKQTDKAKENALNSKNKSINFFGNMELDFEQITEEGIKINVKTKLLDFKNNGKDAKDKRKYRIIHSFYFEENIFASLAFIKESKQINFKINSNCKNFALFHSNRGLEGIFLNYDQVERNSEHGELLSNIETNITCYINIFDFFDTRSMLNLLENIKILVLQITTIQIDTSSDALPRILWKIIATLINADMFNMDENKKNSIERKGVFIFKFIYNEVKSRCDETNDDFTKESFTLGYELDFGTKKDEIKVPLQKDGLKISYDKISFEVLEPNNVLLSISVKKGVICFLSDNRNGLTSKQMNIDVLIDKNLYLRNRLIFRLSIGNKGTQSKMFHIENFTERKILQQFLAGFFKKNAKDMQRQDNTKLDGNKILPHINFTDIQSSNTSDSGKLAVNLDLQIPKDYITKINNFLYFLDYEFLPKKLKLDFSMKDFSIMTLSFETSNRKSLLFVKLLDLKPYTQDESMKQDPLVQSLNQQKKDKFYHYKHSLTIEHNIDLFNTSRIEVPGPFVLQTNPIYNLIPLDDTHSIMKDVFRYGGALYLIKLPFTYNLNINFDLYFLVVGGTTGTVCTFLPSFNDQDGEVLLFFNMYAYYRELTEPLPDGYLYPHTCDFRILNSNFEIYTRIQVLSTVDFFCASSLTLKFMEYFCSKKARIFFKPYAFVRDKIYDFIYDVNMSEFILKYDTIKKFSASFLESYLKYCQKREKKESKKEPRASG